jgi:hypothetical protein
VFYYISNETCNCRSHKRFIVNSYLLGTFALSIPHIVAPRLVNDPHISSECVPTLSEYSLALLVLAIHRDLANPGCNATGDPNPAQVIGSAGLFSGRLFRCLSRSKDLGLIDSQRNPKQRTRNDEIVDRCL